MTTVYISIGNSDDKLTQQDWSRFVGLLRDIVRTEAGTVHGEWLSLPDSRWQNACWCVEVPDAKRSGLRESLAGAAHYAHQDSIAWAEVASVDFITSAGFARVER